MKISSWISIAAAATGALGAAIIWLADTKQNEWILGVEGRMLRLHNMLKHPSPDREDDGKQKVAIQQEMIKDGLHMIGSGAWGKIGISLIGIAFLLQMIATITEE